MNQEKSVDIPRTFFSDQAEAIRFLVSLKEMGVASKDGKYVAMLTKEDGKYLYLLTNTHNDHFVGDYLRPFRCSKENIDIFHRGVNKLADLMLELESTPVEKHEELFARVHAQPNVFGPLASNIADESTGLSPTQEDGT